MKKCLIRLLAMLLSICMMISIAVGCSGSSNTDVPDSGTADSSDAPNKENGLNGIDPSVDPEKYRGTSVTYVTWKDPNLNEDGIAVEKFEKEFGIKVNVQLVSQSNYVQSISADIASGTQGDVFFENNFFPGSLQVMQPLDAAKLDLSADIWNKALVNASTLDGHPYLVDTISNVWAEVDICVYNKAIFNAAGLNTPADYYAAGKWTFDNFRYAAQKISKLGKDYIGAGILGEPALGAAGCSFFTYKDNQMVVSANARLYEVMNYLSQMKQEGIITLDRSGFGNGNQGMALTNCFALKKTGYFTKINPDHLAATYLPVWKEGEKQYVTGIYRGWGLIDGAKNPVGAGLFLRHYLDVSNYDLDETFHNREVTDFFFQITGTYSEDMVYYLGLRGTTGINENFATYWNYTSPSNMNSYLDSQRPIMEEMCEKANAIINEERAMIKKAEAEGTINKVN